MIERGRNSRASATNNQTGQRERRWTPLAKDAAQVQGCGAVAKVARNAAACWRMGTKCTRVNI